MTVTITRELETPVSITPHAFTLDLLLTAKAPISHHDPAMQDKSNIMLFNRAKQLLDMGPAGAALAGAPSISRFMQENEIPSEFEDLFLPLDLPAFVGCAAIRLFMDVYNSAPGTGLFEGPKRYDRLTARARLSATRTFSLREFWDTLTADLQVGPADSADDLPLARLFSLPPALQSTAVRTIKVQANSLTSIARLWHRTLRPSSRRVEDSDKDALAPAKLSLTEDDLSRNPLEAAAVADIEVPAVTANSLRHSVVREPGFLHLMGRLGFIATSPGSAQLPPGVEAIFANGGNIASGASQPSDPFSKANRARELYPLLDLLGGTTDSFDVGESRLKVASWIVCRENRNALQDSPLLDHPAAYMSVFDMMDEVTLTRGHHRGEGAMIYNFETLIPGVPILCRLVLTPYTPVLAQGALGCAIDAFRENVPVIGGQSARGFGFVHVQTVETNALDALTTAQDAYEDYLEQNLEELRDGLITGTLGTGARILS